MSPRQNTSGRSPWRNMLLLLLILPLLLLGGALALLIESQPLVAALAAPSVSDALRAQALAKRLLQGLESRQAVVEIHASAEELDGLLNLAARGLPAFSGLVELSPQSLRIQTSLKLPPTALPGYLNLQLDLLPSRNGLSLGHTRLGRIKVSSRLGLGVMRLVLDLGLGRGEGSAILDSVQGLTISNQQLQLQLRDPSKLKTRLNRLPTRLAGLRDLTFPLASPWSLASVQIYSERLQQITDQLPRNSPPRSAIICRGCSSWPSSAPLRASRQWKTRRRCWPWPGFWGTGVFPAWCPRTPPKQLQQPPHHRRECCWRVATTCAGISSYPQACNCWWTRG